MLLRFGLGPKVGIFDATARGWLHLCPGTSLSIVASLQRTKMFLSVYLLGVWDFASDVERLYCNPEGDGDLMLENAVAR